MQKYKKIFSTSQPAPSNDNGSAQVIEFASIADRFEPSRRTYAACGGEVIEFTSLAQSDPNDPKLPPAA